MMRRLVVTARLGALTVTLLLAACGPGAGDAVGIRTTSGTTVSLVGHWSFMRYFSVGDQTHLSETIWTFAADGTALRTLHTTNLTTGHFDTVTRAARWRIVQGLLEIEYVDVAPSETVRFAFLVISRDRMVLDGNEYVRIG